MDYLFWVLGHLDKIYSAENYDWVIKLANGVDKRSYLESMEMNEQEIKIGTGEHGLGSRDLFTKLYSWDKKSFKPMWLITEKVVDFDDVNKHFSISDLNSVFPTFFSSLNEERKKRLSVEYICDLVVNTLEELSYINGSLGKKEFYDAMVKASLDEEDILSFSELEFHEDYKRIIRACAYTKPQDMHSGNIGISLFGSLSPESFVLLDYMVE